MSNERVVKMRRIGRRLSVLLTAVTIAVPVFAGTFHDFLPVSICSWADSNGISNSSTGSLNNSSTTSHAFVSCGVAYSWFPAPTNTPASFDVYVIYDDEKSGTTQSDDVYCWLSQCNFDNSSCTTSATLYSCGGANQYTGCSAAGTDFVGIGTLKFSGVLVSAGSAVTVNCFLPANVTNKSWLEKVEVND